MSGSVRVIDATEADTCLRSGATLLDARSLRQRGLRFLKGAQRFPWQQTRTGGGRSGLLLPAADLAAAFEAVGVSWQTTVVVACAGAAGWGEGARVAWALAWLHHPDVRWLPIFGSLPTVRAVASSAPTERWPGRLQPALRSTNGVDLPAGAIPVDVRTSDEQQGLRSYGEARAGHVPGARFLPLGQLWSPAGLTPIEQVRALADQAGIPLDGDLVCICTGGVRSAAAMLLLQRAGVGNSVCNHDGGMWAWARDPRRPVCIRS